MYSVLDDTDTLSYLGPKVLWSSTKWNKTIRFIKEFYTEDQEIDSTSLSMYVCRLENKLIAKVLELSFEPTIGNFDQEHNENWYSYLNYFTSTLTQ